MNELPSTAERFSILAFVAMLHIAIYWLPAAPDHNRRQPLKRASAQAADDALSIVVPRGQESSGQPIDWNAELERAAESGVLDGASHARRDFGFPHPPGAPAKPQEFGWDHAHTHRMEPLPGGDCSLT